MSIKVEYSLSQRQSLRMTPQLMQSIQLLQMNGTPTVQSNFVNVDYG